MTRWLQVFYMPCLLKILFSIALYELTLEHASHGNVCGSAMLWSPSLMNVMVLLQAEADHSRLHGKPMPAGPLQDQTPSG